MQQWEPEGSGDRNKINQQRSKNNNYWNGSKTEVMQIANVQMCKCLTFKLMHGSILTA
jgi:hypothetical protein